MVDRPPARDTVAVNPSPARTLSAIAVRRPADIEQRPVEFRHGRRPDQRHRPSNVVAEPPKHPIDPALATGTQAVEVGTASHDGVSPGRNRLHDVAPSSYTTVTDDPDPATDSVGHGEHQRKRSG